MIRLGRHLSDWFTQECNMTSLQQFSQNLSCKSRTAELWFHTLDASTY